MSYIKKRRVSNLECAEWDLGYLKSIPETAQTMSSSYRIAFADHEFLLSDEMRGIRLHLELSKVEKSLDDNGIYSTIAMFGSARFCEDGNLDGMQDSKLKKKEDDSDALIARRKWYYEMARDFSVMVSRGTSHLPGEFVVCTGGGGGIMEAGNRGASDARTDSIGFGIVLKNEKVPNKYISSDLCFNFHYFSIRKLHFLMRAKVIAVFPGGYGTLDELFEALTLIQTHKMSAVPVLLFGKDFWSRVVNFEALVEEGTISQHDLSIFHYVDSAEEGWEYIRNHYNISEHRE